MKPIPEYRRPVNFPPKKVNGTTREHAEELLEGWRKTGWLLGMECPHPGQRNETVRQAA